MNACLFGALVIQDKSIWERFSSWPFSFKETVDRSVFAPSASILDSCSDGLNLIDVPIVLAVLL